MCKNFTVKGFIQEHNLMEKHLEVFKSGNDNAVKNFINIFENYTKLANKKKDLNEIVDAISTDYKINEKGTKNLVNEMWAQDFKSFCTSKRENNVYSFPEFSGSKLTFDHQFDVNCIKITDAIPESIKVVNRNGHMVLAGEPKNKNMQLGVNLTFKVIILHNLDCKKWLVVPYRIRSETAEGVRCDSFALSATNDNPFIQFITWIKGFKKYEKNIGILNINYYDKKFESMPNLFRPNQVKQVMDEVARLTKTGGKKKKSKKKV